MLVTDEFKPNFIKEYRFWDLFVSPKQRYLGRSYIWWRDREPHECENMRFDQIPAEAFLEIQKAWGDVVRICHALGYQTEPYGPGFKLNTSYLANEQKHHNGHMHIHFYPRTLVNFTSSPIGVETMDEDFEKPPISGNERYLDEEQMAKLRVLCRFYAI